MAKFKAGDRVKGTKNDELAIVRKVTNVIVNGSILVFVDWDNPELNLRSDDQVVREEDLESYLPPVILTDDEVAALPRLKSGDFFVHQWTNGRGYTVFRVSEASGSTSLETIQEREIGWAFVREIVRAG
jgi:hypothetical protein